MQPTYIDAQTDYENGFSQDERLRVRHSQDIPEWWLDENKREKAESTKAPAGNFHRFARVPAVVYQQWMKEGFDPTKEPAAKVMARLSQEGLDHFITTGKKL